MNTLNENSRFSEYSQTLLEQLEQVAVACENPGAKRDELLQLDLRLLKNILQRYSRKASSEGQSPGGFLAELALDSTSGKQEKGVRVLTLHAAKGLEFDTVFLLGMNQGSFPDYRNLKANGLEEKRGNAYVAITRAKRKLYLTRCRQRRMPWGDMMPQQRSQFLKDMGIDG